MTVWFITGASRGFGLEITREALRRGHRVVAAARRPDTIRAALPEAGPDLLPVELDVTDEGLVSRAVDEALQRFGRIDVLVNNAGRGLLGAVEEVSDGEAREVFDINVFGLLAVTRAVLPTMRQQRAGTIVNMSSSGGFNGRTGWGVYSATKFAVEGITEALRHELAPLGVRATAIEPGGFRTDALDPASLAAAARRIEDYDETVGPIRTVTEDANHRQPGDPAKAARAIVDLAEGGDVPERLQLGPECFDAVTAKLERVAGEQERWRTVSHSTSY